MSKQTANQAKTDPIRFLSSPKKDCSEVSSKIAILTFRMQKHSHMLDMMLLLFEYLQLMIQAFLFIPALFNDENTNQNVFLRGIKSFAKSIDPGLWLEPETESHIKIIILIGFSFFIVFKYLLFIVVVAIAKFDITCCKLLLCLWSYIFKFQTRVVCCFTTSIFFKVILRSSQDDVDNFGFGRITVLTFCIIMIALEYGLSFFLQGLFSYILPSKGFLASKTNRIEMLNLLQKLITQILLVVSIPDSSTAAWVFSSLNLSFSITREIYYFSTLPLYHLKALSYQAGLSILITSLHLSCFSQVLINSLTYETWVNSFVTIWATFALLMLKMSQGYLRRGILTLLNSESGSPEYLTHKINIIRYLRKHKKVPSHQNQNFDFSFLMSAAINACVKTILHINPKASQEIPDDINPKESVNKLFLLYFESLVIKFPKSDFLKLYSAYICAQKLQNFGGAMKILTSVQRSYSKKIKINISMLIHQMQEKLIARSKSETSQIDLSSYIENLTTVANLKAKMIDQAEVQSKVLQEILVDTPDLLSIFKKSLTVESYRNKIQKEVQKTLTIISDTFIEPLLICAHYSLVLNHSKTEYLSLSKKYWKKYEKYAKFFQSDKLTNENLFEENNVFIMTSGSKHDAGKIIFCSKSIEKIYGNKASSYIGANISSLAPPSFQNIYTSYFKELSEKGPKSNFRNIARSFGYHAKGYIIYIDFFIDFHPFMTQDFCFNVILRPVPTNKEYIILLENGDIESSTEKIDNKLRIRGTKSSSIAGSINIKSISEELSMVNSAFNMIAHGSQHKTNTYTNEVKVLKQVGRISRRREALKTIMCGKSSTNYLSKQKAEELYSIYSTKGRTLRLTPVDQNSNSITYLYRCTVTHYSHESALLKVIALEDNEDDDIEEFQDDQLVTKQESNIERVRSKNTLSRNDFSENNETEMRLNVVRSDDIGSSDEEHADLFKSKEVRHMKPLNRAYNSLGYQNNLTSQIENFTTTEEHLLATLGPKTTGSNKKTIISQVAKISKNETVMDLVSESVKSASNQEFQAKTPVQIIGGSVTGSQQSRTSVQNNISGALKTTLSTKYYSRSLKVICLLFYLLLIVIFASQIILKETLDQGLHFISTSKEIISNAEMRNFILVNIQQTCRLIWDLATGVLNSKNLEVYLGPFFYVFLLSFHISFLTINNKQLFISMNSLEEETRKTLFMKDIKIYESYYDEPNQVYETFDNFQATSRIIENALRGISIMQKSILESKKEIFFMLRNTVNDLLITNEKTSDILMESVNQKQSEISTSIQIYLIITLFLLGLVALLFIWTIWKQYRTEKFNMLALIKLNPSQIKNSLEQINEFKRMIYEEKSFGDIQNQRLLDYLMKPSYLVIHKGNAKKEQIKSPNSKRIWKKYCVYAFNMLILVLVLAGLMAWYSVANKKSINFFQRKQAQFFSINRVKTHISLAVTMSQELFAGNGTTMTHNQPNSQELSKVIMSLNIMKNILPNILMNEEDATYDSEIKSILFEDGCAFIDQIWMFFCDDMKMHGKKTGLMYILSDLQTILQEANDDFKMSNRSSESLIDLEAKTFQALLFPHFVAAAECDAISHLIGHILEKDINEMLEKRNFTYGIFAFIFVFLSVLMWFLVINPLREANNSFKKVLKVFPADLILSSFLLKSFLVKTCKNIANSLKNEF